MPRKLLIFIKNPQLGHVKTRLAATVGDEKALEFYIKLLNYTRQIAEKTDAERTVFYSDFIEKNDNWSPDFFEKKQQFGHDLGERMANAFRESEIRNPKSEIVIIGSDCANLTTEILENAFLSLEKNDFVVGPAFDGGYYLLGMTRFEPSIFEKIDWSTDQVLPQTLLKMAQKTCSIHILPMLSDIDTEADWNSFAPHLH
jgi:uncharacterized protein